jgi:hypothetical protein
MSQNSAVLASSVPTRPLLLAGLVGAVLFVLVFLVEGAIRPGYEPRRHPVSALALGDRGRVQVANFVITGCLMGAFAVGVRRSLVDGPGAMWGPWLLAAFALGLVASGVFAMDPLDDYPPGSERAAAGTASWHAIAHDVAGLVVFGALPAAALVLAGRFRTTSGLAWLGIVSTGAGVICAGLFVVYAILADADPGQGGLLQRATIIVGWGWIALVAGALLANPPEGAA